MIFAKVQVSGIHALTESRKTIPAGLIGGKIEFEFVDSRWDNLTKTIVFQGCETRDVFLDGNTAIIPQEVVARPGALLLVGVYGTDAENAIAIPTMWAAIGEVRSAADPSGDEAADPCLPIWAVLRAELDQLKNSGATFTPHVDEEGNLSWSNDKGLENPETVNIKGETPEVRILTTVEENANGGTRYGVTIEGPKIVDENGIIMNNGTVWDGKDGNPGLSMYTFDPDKGLSEDGTLDRSFVNVPDGYYVKQNDLLLAPNGDIYLAGIEENAIGQFIRYTATFAFSIKGEHVCEGGGSAFDPTVYGLPVLYLTGDTTGMSKDDAVSLGYVYGERSGTAEVKWQGTSSLSYPKKNYTIKFDTAFEAVEGWGEQKKYCLKANFIDHSHARNLINAKLWGDVLKSRPYLPNGLANLPNAGAVDGFPCLIYLNGEFHGLYTWNIPKDGWMFGLDGTETRAAIVCAEYACDATRFKANATIGTEFELEYVTNEDDADWVQESLNNLINACIVSDGTDLDTVVAKYIDWNSAIDFYCFVTLIGGFDLVAKNYLLVTFDGVKWRFGAYDMDSTHGLDWTGDRFYDVNKEPMPERYAATHKLMELVRKYKYEELTERYKELRASVMSDSSVINAFSDFIAKIPAEIYREDARKYPSIPSTAASNLAQISEFYRMRAAAVDAEMHTIGAPPPILSNGDTWYKGATDPTTITKIKFVSEYTETGNEIESWDASNSVNPGTIKGYVIDDTVVVAIQNKAKNIMLYSGIGMFKAFKNVTEITGTELFVARENTETSMEQACYLLNKLTTPIHIPEGITNTGTFYTNCTALTKPGSIPSTVHSAQRMYDGCSAMTIVPKIPARMVNMNAMFRYCTKFTNADGIVIPATVTNLSEAFNGCNSLVGTMVINAVNITDYTNAFRNCPLASKGTLTLIGNSTQLNELAATSNLGTVIVGN